MTLQLLCYKNADRHDNMIERNQKNECVKIDINNHAIKLHFTHNLRQISFEMISDVTC